MDWADSEAVLEIVEAFDDETLAEARWKLAVPGMDLLLEGLGLDLEQKLAVLRAVRDGVAREHRADQKLLRQLGERYRAERRDLEALLDPEIPGDGPLAPGLDALRRRAERLQPIMAQLRRVAADGVLTFPLTDLAPSFLHMHANRLLHTDQRTQEMVLYDFLYRLYDARAARARTPARS
jgi:thiopeptide-type bacteriocin biosynthesis protein